MSLESFLTSGTSPGESKSCRVALLGFGRVGSAVARRLTSANHSSNLRLTHILDRRADQKRSAHPDLVWTNGFHDVLASDVDVVVEAVGGTEPATDWIRAALMAGKSVVTANKQVIARDGPALLTLAARQGRQLRYEAAVGGAMPIVRAIGDGLAGDHLTRIVAIVNGTCNAVLSRMEATGCSLVDAVADARSHGWAEADPSDDLDGIDARAKLAILCALAFRLRINPTQIETRSIAEIRPQDFRNAARNGATIRQLAWAEHHSDQSELTVWVAPRTVPRSSIFGRTVGPQNAAIVSGVYAGDIGIFGAGAGGEATAVAVVGDLLAVARDRAAVIPAAALSTPRLIKGLSGLPAGQRSAGFPPSLEATADHRSLGEGGQPSGPRTDFVEVV